MTLPPPQTASAMGDFPAYCARPACRAEMRSGRRYCSTACEQAARGELDAARARLRSLSASLRQASADVARFADHDDDRPTPDLEVALAAARAALRHVPDESPGMAELRALVDAVSDRAREMRR